jgi:ribosomal protein S18 acetylase RimI-like enzyme
LAGIETSLPSSAFTVRPSTNGDVNQVGSLYFRAYPPGDACTTEAEAIADVAASYHGEYGAYLHEASPVIVHDGELVASVMTVQQAPWDDTPDCPFIIELFTAPGYRRAGLATVLLAAAASAVMTTDPLIALRVDASNTAAITLYERLGFRPWHESSAGV